MQASVFFPYIIGKPLATDKVSVVSRRRAGIRTARSCTRLCTRGFADWSMFADCCEASTPSPWRWSERRDLLLCSTAIELLGVFARARVMLCTRVVYCAQASATMNAGIPIVEG